MVTYEHVLCYHNNRISDDLLKEGIHGVKVIIVDSISNPEWDCISQSANTLVKSMDITNPLPVMSKQ